jgi:hypothetical protein
MDDAILVAPLIPWAGRDHRVDDFRNRCAVARKPDRLQRRPVLCPLNAERQPKLSGDFEQRLDEAMGIQRIVLHAVGDR